MSRMLGYPLFAGMALLESSPAFSQQPQGQYYGPHMWDGGWHGWFFAPIMMIFFLGLAVVVVVLLLRWLGGPGHGGAPHSHPGRAPLDILKERFAKGEIDKEEYEERRRILGE